MDPWMNQYGNVPLGEMHLPGSHDAGIPLGLVDKPGVGTNSNSVTQLVPISEQLQMGTRFFDLRLAKVGKKVVSFHTTAGSGARSKETADATLEGVGEFCASNPSEVVIVRISHTDPNTQIDQIIKDSVSSEVLHKGEGNLCLKTLSQIRAQGNMICIMPKLGKSGLIFKSPTGFKTEQSQGIHEFLKYKGSSCDKGIAICGCYSGTHTIEKVLCNGLKGQYDHNANHIRKHEHLWQVYWQKTYLNPFSTTGIQSGTQKSFKVGKDGRAHGGTHAGTDYMLNLMKGIGPQRTDIKVQSSVKADLKNGVFGKEKVMYSTEAFRTFSLPNIISYDFVNEVTNQKIIDLNGPARMGFIDDGLDI